MKVFTNSIKSPIINSLVFGISIYVLTSCYSKHLADSDIDADINFLKHKIEEIHPNPYWNLPAEQFDSLLNVVKSNVHGKRKINQKRLFQLLNPVITQLNDGHTRMEVPAAVANRAFFWGSKILPLSFSIKDSELFFKANLQTKELIHGDYQVLSINGLPTQKLITQLLANKYGYNIDFRFSQINEVSLTRELWLYFDMNKQFEVIVLTPEGKTEQLIFEGIHQPKYYRRLYKMTQNEFLTSSETFKIVSEYGFYQEEISNHVAVIKYTKFISDSKDFINSAFNLAKSSEIEHLIFDLRGNPGGTSNIYNTLLSHLTRDSIMIFSNGVYKVSQDLINKQTFGTDFPYPSSEALGKVRTLDKEMMWFVPNSDVSIFKGRFYVLMDRGTFSAASGFCALIQDNDLGLLIGEPSGGLGSSFGASIIEILPNSNIPVFISTSRFYRPNGDMNFAPVLPNIEINCFGRDWNEIFMDIKKIF
jgi:hypothetical protein